MPRRKSEKGRPMNSQGVELRAVRVELTEATHKLLRIAAAKADKSLGNYVRVLVEAHLHGKPTGEKGEK